MRKLFLVVLGVTLLASQVLAGYERVASYEGRFADEVVIGDADGDGLWEVYEPAYPETVIVREYTGFEFTTYYLDYYAMVWGLGDINKNGLPDLVCQSGDPGMGGNGYLRIYESPESGSFPTELIAQVTLPGRKVYYYARITDLDNDGRGEVLMLPNHFQGGGVRIYEWENDGLSLVWEYVGGIGITNIVGDFNGNGKLEFAFFEAGGKMKARTSPVVAIEELAGGKANGYIRVFECTGDNQYEEIYQYTYPHSVSMGGAGNVLDLDGDGQDEFLFGFSSCTAGYHYLVFHHNGSDFEVLFDVGYSTGYFGSVDAAAGDFDGDGKDEFVVDVHPRSYVYDYRDGELIEETLVDGEINIFGFESRYFDDDCYEDIYAVVFTSQTMRLDFYEYSPTGIEKEIHPRASQFSLEILPTVGRGLFEIKGVPSDETLNIYDIRGAKVAQTRTGKQRLNLPSGAYFLVHENSGQSQKFVILN